MQFTKDTSKLLASIYKLYLERRKEGLSNKISKQFKADFYKEIKTLSNWSDDDISDSLVELKQAHFIKMNIIGGFIIEDALIIQMENRFKSSLSEITKYIADLVADTAVGLIL